VTACAVQHDFVTFEIVAWGFGEGPTPSRRIAEAVAETIQFPDAQRKK
jgi:hypothetical protein